jgi:TM2 domain-containing membrane protein YozV
MAIRVHCPFCHQYLEKMTEVCPHCDSALPPGVVISLAAACGEPPQQRLLQNLRAVPDELIPITGMAGLPPGQARPTPAQTSGLRPWLAAALSLLCGLGQLYNGQVVKGIALMLLGAAAILSLPSLVGKIAIPLLWGFAIVDAFRVARDMRHEPSRCQ